MPPRPCDKDILAIRRFNRFYTQHLGLLHKRLMDSSYSLVEARVLYELAQNTRTTASTIRATLGMDQGYLSRILKRFEETGLLVKEPSPHDARSTLLSLSNKGKEEATMMAEKSGNDIADKLHGLSNEQIAEMVHAMNIIEGTLNNPEPKTSTALIRNHRAGDIGWVIQQHGKLYREEYGFNENFEALCAQIAADFLKTDDSRYEQCWIAELDNENVGSVFLVKEDDETARLRLLLVHPKARGHGLGARLVDECISFAKHAGYKHIVLWTNANLVSARRIYEAAGFTLQAEKAHDDFGKTQRGQHWALSL